jgi:hypothetical protein
MTRLFSIMLVFALGGCSVVANSTCFSQRIVVLPDRELVLSNVSNGQPGKDLADAVLSGKIDDVSALITKDKRLLTTSVGYDPARSTERPQGQYGDLLTLAISRCDLAMEERLLELGMPVNGVQIGSALSLALLSDKPEMAELLLARGASPDPQKLGGQNVMKDVSAFQHVGGAMMLLRHGLDLAWEDELGFTHLQDAIMMQQYRIAELLVKQGANPWRFGPGGSVPAQYFSRPMILKSEADDAARKRLLAQVEREAAAKGFPWPLPDFRTISQKILAGSWPTPQMRAAGVPPVSSAVMNDLRQRFTGTGVQ